MIRAVLDTNVIVSALLRPSGAPARVFLLAIGGRAKGFWVRPVDTIRACSDPDDDIFLECAAAAQADYLVTGNIRHFPSSWKKTRIVTPRLFLDLLSGDAAPDQR